VPTRKIVSELMADLISVLAHPHRFRLIEELASGEKDVHEIAQILNVPQPTVSQHLSALRSKRIVVPRRDGRRVFYSLRHKWVAKWLLQGLRLLEEDSALSADVLAATRLARKSWERKGLEKGER
jgi:DNA-binding transcriptional ArsR family regulator